MNEVQRLCYAVTAIWSQQNKEMKDFEKTDRSFDSNFLANIKTEFLRVKS